LFDTEQGDSNEKKEGCRSDDPKEAVLAIGHLVNNRANFATYGRCNRVLYRRVALFLMKVLL